MYRFWFFLTVCIYGMLAFHIKDEFEYLNNWMHNDDTATENRNKDAKCKKDLLLVVDASFSIKEDFKGNVKPFLKNLVTNSFLDVRSDGTRIGLVIFSAQDKTKKVFDVGQFTNADKLAEKMDEELDYPKVGGSYTRTDLGLKKANEIFTENDPWNERSKIDDVVILITDGAPREKTDTNEYDSVTIDQTKEEAQKLKDKNISLVVAAVGPDRKKFKPLMTELATSPDYVFEADFSNMTNIMDKLVDKTCIETGKHPCNCDKIDSIIKTIEPGKSTVKVDLPPFPPLNCEGDAKEIKEKTEVKPQLPREFPAGVHVVNVTYFLKNSRFPRLICPMKVKVRGTCTCKEIAPITRTIPPGKSTVELDLPTQSPICENGAEVKGRAEIIPQIPRELPVGSYEFNYVFTLKKAKDKKITCPIKVQVKEFEGTCSCDKNGKTVTRSIPSESSAAKVTLKPPPITCTHDAKVIGATVAAPATNRFPAGKHIVNFKAFLGKAKDYSIICPLIIEVKVLCDGVPYNPKEKLCCCAKIHKKETGYKCCGIHYYNPNMMKCCGNSNLYSSQESC